MRHVLITGGTGTLGNALIPRLLETCSSVAVYSRDEKKQSDMRAKYKDVRYEIGDVRDKGRLCDVVRDVRCDQIIHAAAMKRVQSCETHPGEAIQTNVTGTRNVMQASKICNCQVMFISSDKAVYPINTYGMTKALAEKTVLDAGGTVVRYGNILNSRGSVVEKWLTQMKQPRPLLRCTDHVRFWMQMSDAVDVVLEAIKAVEIGSTNSLFVPIMRAASVTELAEAFLLACGKEKNKDVGIDLIHGDHGEKQQENILTEEEWNNKRGVYFSPILADKYEWEVSVSKKHISCNTSDKWEVSELAKILYETIKNTKLC